MLKFLYFLVIIVIAVSLTVGLATVSLADWNEGDCYKMHFPQLPDLGDGGVAIVASAAVFPGIEVADDFQCMETGNITDIHIWGSYIDNMVSDNRSFVLRIYDDIPAYESPTGYSMPGELLWSHTFAEGEFDELPLVDRPEEILYSPWSGIPHSDNMVWQYNFNIDPVDAFPQEEGNIYWLSVYEEYGDNCVFGWKTSTNHWNDDAVWTHQPGFGGPWYELQWPPEGPDPISLDMAFVITTGTGTIILEKQTDPDGDDRSFDILEYPTGALVTSLQDDGTHSIDCLQPGTYMFVEDVPNCWSLTTVDLSEVGGFENSSYNSTTGIVTLNLEAGETINVTFNNTKWGIVTVEKETDPPGSDELFEFTGTFSANLSDGGSFSGCIPPGQHTVTELVPDCWELTEIISNDNNGSTDISTGTATINLEPGEEVTVTFKDMEYGYIIVEKQTDPDGAPSIFTFAGDLSGTIGDGEQLISPCLRPGDYTSWELPKPYWKLVDIMLDDAASITPSTYDFSARQVYFNLDPGETVKATFTNRFIPPPPEEPPVEDHGAPVGIEVFSVNKPALLAPWIALVVVIIAGGIILVRRYRAHS